jgi:hypothetical protein
MYEDDLTEDLIEKHIDNLGVLWAPHPFMGRGDLITSDFGAFLLPNLAQQMLYILHNRFGSMDINN